MRFLFMSPQVALPSEPFVAQQTLESPPWAMSLVMPPHAFLPSSSMAAARPGAVNRQRVTSKMIVPLAIFVKGLIALGPIAEPFSMLSVLVVFQTNHSIFFELSLACF